MGGFSVVVLNDFEFTKDAQVRDVFIGRPDEQPFGWNKETLETGAINGLPWKEQRRFSIRTLKDLGLGKSKMEGRLQEEISSFLEQLEQNVDKPYCIYSFLAPSMSNNIGSLLFGKRFEYNDPVKKMLTRTVSELINSFGQADGLLFFPRLKKILLSLGLGKVDKVERNMKELRDYILKEIDEHEESIDHNNARDYIDEYLLEIEKRSGDPSFAKPILQDMAFGFFIAGSETVRVTVEWLVLTAAAHQDSQRRIQREIDSVVGREDLPSWPHQKSMPYTEAFIMEVMRWRTIIPINLPRCAGADDEIAGYFIPKGTWIMANLWAIHHDPKYWGSDAEEFRPERFLTEDGKSLKKRDHFLPFSIGKRQCPGEPFARIVVFLYFTSILQKFNVRLPDGKVADFEGDLGLSLVPKAQKLIFTKRD